MIRCQHFQPCVCSVPLLAEAVTVGMAGLAAQKSGLTASLSPENAGPIVATTLESLISVAAAGLAWVGSPWLSCGSRVTVKSYVLADVACEIASSAPCFSLMPSWAESPESAPMKPILNAFAVGVVPLLLLP